MSITSRLDHFQNLVLITYTFMKHPYTYSIYIAILLWILYNI